MDNPRTVKTINFSDFLLNFDEDDYIVVKLDIEGAEYEVIESILDSGTITRINELFIEWHDHFFTKSSEPLKQRLLAYDIKIDNNWM